MKNVQSINTIGINRKLTTESRTSHSSGNLPLFFHPVIFFQKPVSMLWMFVVGYGFHFSAHPVSVGT
jgi:hypothetical protein